MPKSIQFKKLLLLMLLFSSSTNVFSEQIIYPYIDHQWENDRYINHKDGIVTDTKTGLMWKQCIEGLSGPNCSTGTAKEYNYEKAIESAEAPFATYSDWRFPNIKELASLVAYDRRKPAINSTLFPNTPGRKLVSWSTRSNRAFFWSSSPTLYRFGGKNEDEKAWNLSFEYGYDNDDSRYYSHYVRLVRGGQ
jgi:hypothetical protein